MLVLFWQSYLYDLKCLYSCNTSLLLSAVRTNAQRVFNAYLTSIHLIQTVKMSSKMVLTMNELHRVCRLQHSSCKKGKDSIGLSLLP